MGVCEALRSFSVLINRGIGVGHLGTYAPWSWGTHRYGLRSESYLSQIEWIRIRANRIGSAATKQSRVIRCKSFHCTN